MPKLISLPTFKDKRGSLTVIEKIVPFEVKRVYFIYNSEGYERGFHKHKLTKQALIVTSGSCSVFVKNSKETLNYNLDSPSKCLMLNPEDYHWMNNFKKETVLLVLASEFYDINDYLDNDS